MQATRRQQDAARSGARRKCCATRAKIVPAFNAYIYFRIGYWLAEGLARLLYRVRVGFADNERLAKIDPEATVVFVMNHRSNMDYVLAAFLAAEQTASPTRRRVGAHLAAATTGARHGRVLRAAATQEPLYRRVLERYVQWRRRKACVRRCSRRAACTATAAPSRAARHPRLHAARFDTEGKRDVVFVPVGINYDRTLEDRSLVRRLNPNAPRRSRWFVLRTTFGFVFHNIRLMLRNRWQRFGYACVNSARPLVRDYCRQREINFSRLPQETRYSEIEQLGRELMARIERWCRYCPWRWSPPPFSKRRPARASSISRSACTGASRICSATARWSSCRPTPVPSPWKRRSACCGCAAWSSKPTPPSADAKSLDVLNYYANSIAAWQTMRNAA